MFGTANGRLTRQATGPVLAILTDCRPPCFCVLSNWMLTPLRAVTAQSGIWPSRAGGCSKPGLATTSNGGGLRSAAARAPSRRICAPSAGLDRAGPGDLRVGALHARLRQLHRHQIVRIELDFPIQAAEAASGLSGSIFRLPLSSSMRQSGPASTCTRAVMAKGASLTAYRYVRPP